MPEINCVPFVYEPIPGNLFLDHFRSNFYMERLDEVKDELQTITTNEPKVARPIEGTVKFSDADGKPPIIRGVRYLHPNDRTGDEGVCSQHLPRQLNPE
jgi:hypothetical protein